MIIETLAGTALGTCRCASVWLCDRAGEEAMSLCMRPGSYVLKGFEGCCATGRPCLDVFKPASQYLYQHHIVTSGQHVLLAQVKSLHVAIEIHSTLSAGQTVCDIWRQSGKAPNRRLATSVDDMSGFWLLMLDALAHADKVLPLHVADSPLR